MCEILYGCFVLVFNQNNNKHILIAANLVWPLSLKAKTKRKVREQWKHVNNCNLFMDPNSRNSHETNYLRYSIFGRLYMYIYEYKSCTSIVLNSINDFVLISCWQKHKKRTATQNETWKFSRKAQINNDCKSSDDDDQGLCFLPGPPWWWFICLLRLSSWVDRETIAILRDTCRAY